MQLKSSHKTNAAEIIPIPQGMPLAFFSHEQLLTSEPKKRQHGRLRCPPCAGYVSSACAKGLLCYDNAWWGKEVVKMYLVPLRLNF